MDGLIVITGTASEHAKDIMRLRQCWQIGTGFCQVERGVLEHLAVFGVPDRLALDRIDLLGISCGGPGSVRVAAERPEVVRSLILFASYETGTDIIDGETQRALTDLVRVNWGIGSQSITSVLLPGAMWAEKAGTFVNRDGRLQEFKQSVARHGLEQQHVVEDIDEIDAPTTAGVA